MSGYRILSAAAVKLGLAASSTAIAAATPPAPSGMAPPAATAEGDIDVVTLTDAQAAVAEAEIRGASAERARTSAVMSSDAGKANPTMAAWMLEHNASAPADGIITALAAMPAAAPAAAAPAPATEPAPPAPPAAITTPLAQTPKIEIAPNANANTSDGQTQEEIDKLWDSGIASAEQYNPFGGPLAGGIPRTGN